MQFSRYILYILIIISYFDSLTNYILSLVDNMSLCDREGPCAAVVNGHVDRAVLNLANTLGISPNSKNTAFLAFSIATDNQFPDGITIFVKMSDTTEPITVTRTMYQLIVDHKMPLVTMCECIAGFPDKIQDTIFKDVAKLLKKE